MASQPKPARPPPPRPLPPATQFQRLREESFRVINEGLSLDQRGEMQSALSAYQRGLEMIEKILRHELSNDQSPEALSVTEKMQRTRAMLVDRIRLLTATPSRPPSYDDAVTSSSSSSQQQQQQPRSEPTAPSRDALLDEQFVALGDEILGADGGVSIAPNAQEANAEELFRIEAGVQIFFLTPDGLVSAPSYPSPLTVFKFREESAGRPPAFLRVGDWTYPLYPGASPAFQSDFGAYMFPDVNAAQGHFVGLILPEGLPAQVKNDFEQVLKSFSKMKRQEDLVVPAEAGAEAGPSTPTAVEVRRSQKVGGALASGGMWLAEQLKHGAVLGGALIARGSASLVKRLRPAEEPVTLSPKVHESAQNLRYVSHVAVRVSAMMVDKLGEGTKALALYLAPKITEHGGRLLAKYESDPAKQATAKKAAEDVLHVARGGIQGWAFVFDGLEKSAKILGQSLAVGAINVVTHKYGNDAARVAENCVYSAGNVAMAGFNANQLGPKAIAKKVVKDTAKESLEQVVKSNSSGDLKTTPHPHPAP